MMPANKTKNTYSVGQINSYIKNMFAQDYMLRSVYVRGEVSNVKYHSSGHIYFTMKDKAGTLACVMFAGNRGGLRFNLREGQQIITFGSIDVYERDGKYQMYAREIVPDGEGRLYERFEQLKRELEEMGMFDARYKKPIPAYINTLGVVTAPTGAAIRDIINITKRRHPLSCQGPGRRRGAEHSKRYQCSSDGGSGCYDRRKRRWVHRRSVGLQ